MISFLILSFKLTLQIFLRHFIWKTSSLCSCCLGKAHVSLAHNSVDCIMIASPGGNVVMIGNPPLQHSKHHASTPRIILTFSGVCSIAVETPGCSA